MVDGRQSPILVTVDKKGDHMNDTILMAELNRDRNIELRSEGCRRCARTRTRWITSEFRRIRRSS